ncbi:MAG: hypothetical protein AB7V42_08110 [Thermoleophilia bacterium]
MTGRLKARLGRDWWLAIGIGVAVALGAVIAVNAATDEAGAQGGNLTTRQYIQVTQRIASAAVRRSNESLTLLDPIRPNAKQPGKVLGWKTAQIQDGAITSAKLDASVRDGQPRWAVIEATTGKLVRGKGAVSAAKPADVGRYDITFDRDITACSYQVTPGSGDKTETAVAQVSAWASSSDPKVVVVRTAVDGAQGTPEQGVPTDSNAVPFQVAVFC